MERSQSVAAGGGPGALLAMFRQDIAPLGPQPDFDLNDLADINREILANATRWGFERPSRRATLGLKVPPRGDNLQIERGLNLVGGPPDSELIRMSKPTRWAA